MSPNRKPPDLKRSNFTGFNMTPRERDELGQLRDMLAARNPEIEISTASAIRTAINAAVRAMTEPSAKGSVRVRT